MKKFIYVSAIIGGLFFVQPSQAQISININLGASYPSWIASSYQDAKYIYMPELDMYYDMYNKSYVYYDNYKWVSQRNVPIAYQHMDFRNARKVRVSAKNPWNNNAYYRNAYVNKGAGKGKAVYGKNSYGQNKKHENRSASFSNVRQSQSPVRSKQQVEARAKSRNSNNNFDNNNASRVRSTR